MILKTNRICKQGVIINTCRKVRNNITPEFQKAWTVMGVRRLWVWAYENPKAVPAYATNFCYFLQSMWSHKSIFQEKVDVAIFISSFTKKGYINVFTSFYILNVCIENNENNRKCKWKKMIFSKLFVEVLIETETSIKIKKWIEFFC